MKSKLPDEVFKLLNVWKDKIDANEKIHREKAIMFRRYYYMLGVPATVISGLLTASTVSIITQCNELMGFCIAQSLMSGIVTTLIGIQTYLQLMSRFVDNKMASDRYQALSRTLDTILTTSDGDVDMANILNNIRSTFDDIVQTSPILPITNTTLTYKVFDRTTRSISKSDSTTRTEIKNEDVKLPTGNNTPRISPESKRNKQAKPASKQELEIINKTLPKDNVCIDIDLEEKRKQNYKVEPISFNTGLTHNIDPMFLWQLQRFGDNK